MEDTTISADPPKNFPALIVSCSGKCDGVKPEKILSGGTDSLQLSFSACRPCKLKRQQSDRRHILPLFRSSSVYSGFEELS